MRFSRRSRRRSQLRVKYPARKSTSRILISSTGWNGPRFTLASLPVGPRPKSISRRTGPARRPAACSTSPRAAGNRRRAEPAAPAAGSPETRPLKTCWNSSVSRSGSRMPAIRRKPDAREQVQRRQQRAVAAEAGPAPYQRHQIETGKIDQRPAHELGPEFRLCTHGSERLHLSQGKRPVAAWRVRKDAQPRERPHVMQRP